MNNGTGSFPPGQTTTLNTGPRGVTFGDLDGDPDFLIPIASGVTVWRNNGSGGFTLSSTLAGPISLALGDADADRDLDLVAADSAGTSVRLNNGSGLFAAPVSYGTLSGGANFLALADIDNDGDLDLTTATNGPTVALRLNQGTGPLPVELAAFTANQNRNVQPAADELGPGCC